MAVDFRFRTIDRTLYIWVEGSNDRQDWVRNFRTLRVRAFAGRRGIFGGLCRVNRLDRAEALEVVRELRVYIDSHPGRIVVGGHSRGGAIAQCLASELVWRKRGAVQRLIVYGSKRTGNRAFRLILAECMVRNSVSYRNRGDWVPFLPPWYARNPNPRILNRTWQPLLRAHADYPREEFWRSGS